MKVVEGVEQLKQMIGLEVGVSDWFLVAQAQVDLFAKVTHDHQFIHTDPEKAALTPFGGTIAHGFLSLSMLSYFAENGCGLSVKGVKLFINYGFDRVRFISPVRVGSNIRARSQLLSFTEMEGGALLIKLRVTVEIDGSDKPALLADWLMMAVN